MTGKNAFEKITDISDKFLEEAAFVPETVVTKKRRERGMSGFSRFMNSGWGVAMVCCLVAIGTIVGMVAWGRMGGPIEPPPGTAGGTVVGTDDWYETNDGISTHLTNDRRFDFSYTFSDGATSLSARLGETFSVNASVVNVGESFTYTGASSDFSPYAKLVYSDGDYTIHGMSGGTDDIGTFTVHTGEQGGGWVTFTLPADAPEGTYDLILSYDGESQRFAGTLTVNGSAVTDQTTTELSEKTIINQAKKIVMRRMGTTDLSAYRVLATRDDHGDWNLEFRIYIQGYPTTDVIRLKLAPDGKEIDYHSNFGDTSRFSLYIPHVTEKMVDEAIAKLGDIDKADPFWQIDSYGYLCIGYEVTYDGGNCAIIDMVNEQVCPKPE